ncbi:cation:proton antiporter regulatory subunit [Bacillus testis]|uniref:cation:proton antiporter regulatory subunit n=1 Tax=Bacillus testis TaxID=1622072 RepID=UPI00067EFDE6|nr:TrkA C-terminal domain-containing protein [Bacillus testis]
MDIRETELPGIGQKYEIITQEREKIVIVIHDDGRREMYHFDLEEDESISSITFNDQESRKVAAILGGMVYEPKKLETIEMAFSGLMIEWFKVEKNARISQHTIGDMDIRNNYKVNVVAVVKNNMKKQFSPGANSKLEAGDTLVLAGERADVKAFVSEMLKEVSETQ